VVKKKYASKKKKKGSIEIKKKIWF
jgi:hypothetical protein